MSQFVMPLTLRNKLLSHFLIFNLKFVKPSVLVKLCNNFFQRSPERTCEVFVSHFVIKTVFRKYPNFWEKLVQKFKIVSLSWNLVTRIFRMCWIQKWYYFFFALNGKYRFWKNLVKNPKCLHKLNFGTKSKSFSRILWWC